VPTDVVPVPVAAATAAAPTSVPPAVAAMMRCLDGNWTAPVSREFTALGISDRTNGAVRSGTGLLRLTLGQDRTFTFTYDQVTLSMAAGSAVVNGPVTGTWSLQDNTLRTTLITNATKVDVKLGPFTLGAPSAVASAVETLPPTDVMIGCATDKLTMQLSTADGGGTVTFDRA
jgi:hypothetical protein